MDTIYNQNTTQGSGGTNAPINNVRLVWSIVDPNTGLWVVDPKKQLFGTFNRARLFHTRVGADKVCRRMEREFSNTLIVVECSIRMN